MGFSEKEHLKLREVLSDTYNMTTHLIKCLTHFTNFNFIKKKQKSKIQSPGFFPENFPFPTSIKPDLNPKPATTTTTTTTTSPPNDSCLDSSFVEVHPFHHFFSLEALLGRYSNSPESRSSRYSSVRPPKPPKKTMGFFMAWSGFPWLGWVFHGLVGFFFRKECQMPFQVEH